MLTQGAGAAWAFALLATVVILFQCALAFGAPWGEYTLGGKYPGRLPFKARIGSAFAGVVLAAFSAIMLARAGVLDSGWPGGLRIAAWVVVGYLVLCLIANVLTPSRRERRLWAPFVTLMLAASVMVAMG